MLENGPLEFVNILVTMGSCITVDEYLHRFNTYFCFAVAMWEVYLAQMMAYTTFEEEITND